VKTAHADSAVALQAPAAGVTGVLLHIATGSTPQRDGWAVSQQEGARGYTLSMESWVSPSHRAQLRITLGIGGSCVLAGTAAVLAAAVSGTLGRHGCTNPALAGGLSAVK
jgi:hypothetical protein